MSDRDEPRENTTFAGRLMVYGAWVLALGLLTLLFTEYFEYEHNPNRRVASTDTAEARQITLVRNRAGHYVANGEINGQAVTFLLDTGATDVAVPADLANRIGLQRGRSVPTQTANGVINTWSTRLDKVALGNIEMTDVSASILPGANQGEVLLGMAFLKHLELVQRGDTLTIRQIY